MTTLTIELPDALAEEARDRGLLDSDSLQAMIRDKLRADSARELLATADKLAAAKVPPMTLAEIQQEVDAVRSERRRRVAAAGPAKGGTSMASVVRESLSETFGTAGASQEPQRTIEDFTFVGLGRDAHPPDDTPVSVDHDKWLAEAIGSRWEDPDAT